MTRFLSVNGICEHFVSCTHIQTRFVSLSSAYIFLLAAVRHLLPFPYSQPTTCLYDIDLLFDNHNILLCAYRACCLHLSSLQQPQPTRFFMITLPLDLAQRTSRPSWDDTDIHTHTRAPIIGHQSLLGLHSRCVAFAQRCVCQYHVAQWAVVRGS